LLPGKKVLIRNSVPENKERNKGRWKAKDPDVIAGTRDTVNDPRCNGDPAGTVKATIQFFSNVSGHDTGTIDLPCQNWSALDGIASNLLRRGYLYRDKELDDGPCRLVSVKGVKQVQADCRGKGATSDFLYDLTEGTDEGMVNVVLTMGLMKYCTAFDDHRGKDGSDGRKFLGRRAPAPSSCQAPPSPSAAFLDMKSGVLD